MDPGTKVGVLFGGGLLVLAGGWRLFHWLISVHEDSTDSEGEEADDPAGDDVPPHSTSND